MAKKVLILNGPNLNMLGTREPEIYGSKTLDDIMGECISVGAALGLEVEAKQSNDESELVGWIQEARETHVGIIINAAALTHTSVAIMDALLAVDIPVIEVHLSNIFKREEFRHHSYVSGAAVGLICGFGGKGYILALEAMAELV
jgi:3-dehydroquinate dehydratase-2